MKNLIDPLVIKAALCNTQQITFEVTEKCNLKCYYCAYGTLYSNKGKRNGKILKIETALSLLRYMKQLWLTTCNNPFCKDISIGFYGGEPLLNMPCIVRIINYIEKECKGCGRYFHYSMTTNGVLLDKYSMFLVEHKFNLLISLDGDRKGSSYRIFSDGNESFEKVVRNIKLLKEQYPKYFSQKVSFNSVLHDRNSVGSLQSFFKENFEKTPNISELNTSGVSEDKKDLFNKIFKSKMNSLLESRNVRHVEKGLHQNSPSYHSASTYLLYNSEFAYRNYNEMIYGEKFKQKRLPSGTCIPFSKKIFCAASGLILPCERIGVQFVLGRIVGKNVKINYSKIAKLYNSYYSKMESECSSCYLSNGCPQCMLLIPDVEKKNCKISCGWKMDKNEFKKYKNEQLMFLSRNPRYYKEIMNNVKIR